MRGGEEIFFQRKLYSGIGLTLEIQDSKENSMLSFFYYAFSFRLYAESFQGNALILHDTYICSEILFVFIFFINLHVFLHNYWFIDVICVLIVVGRVKGMCVCVGGGGRYRTSREGMEGKNQRGERALRVKNQRDGKEGKLSGWEGNKRKKGRG